MIVLLVFFLVCTVYVRCLRVGKVDAVIETWLAFTALTVMFAEGLSFFHIYNIVALAVCWLFIDLALVLYIFIGIKNSGKLQFSIDSNIKTKLFLVFILLLISLIMIRALLYPSENTDSYMYHLERAYMYYKNGSIHNYPAAYCWVNYAGPLNAIFMAQSIILSQGSDLFCNLVQFPLLLTTTILTCKIPVLLGIRNKNMVYISGILAISMPLAVLQAATTQCDLMLSGYCLISVYYVVKYLEREKSFSMSNSCFLGISAGAAVLTKVSAGLILLPFAIVFIIKLCTRYKKKLYTMLTTLVSGLFLTTGWFLRNAQDLNGDFLAISISGNSMGSSIKENIISNILGRFFLNSVYTLGGRNALYVTLTGIAKRIYLFIGGSENISIYTCLLPLISHDYLPYPVYTLMILLGLFLGAGYAIKRNKKWHVTTYIICAGISWFLVAISMPPGIPSIVRYLMPCVFLELPFVICALEKVYERKFFKLFILACCIVTYGIAIYDNFFDYTQPLVRYWYNETRRELREHIYPDKNWLPAIDEYKEIFENEKVTTIAVQQEVISGFYPLLYELGEITVKTINSTFASLHEDSTYEPDAIVLICESGSEPQEISYHGNIYAPVSGRYYLYYNNGETQLYLLQR